MPPNARRRNRTYNLRRGTVLQTAEAHHTAQYVQKRDTSKLRSLNVSLKKTIQLSIGMAFALLCVLRLIAGVARHQKIRGVGNFRLRSPSSARRWKFMGIGVVWERKDAPFRNTYMFSRCCALDETVLYRPAGASNEGDKRHLAV